MKQSLTPITKLTHSALRRIVEDRALKEGAVACSLLSLLYALVIGLMLYASDWSGALFFLLIYLGTLAFMAAGALAKRLQ